MENQQPSNTQSPAALAAQPAQKLSNQGKVIFAVAIFILVAIFGVGMKWIFSVSPANAPFFLFDYAVGLSMIFLPCTLPLAFVVVPLSMGKGYAKGLGIALSFGIGVAMTLSFYGALIGAFGQALGIANVELAKNILYAIAGAMAIFFALGEIGLTKMRMPSYSGKIPDFIQKRQDFLKAGMLGLFLGNVGVGCPNPLFNAVIIPKIIAEGDIFQGWLIMLVQALGRFTPLLLLAMLGILGVNATTFLIKRRGMVERATGWATVFVGGFMFTLGLFTHDWYVYSGTHSLLETITREETITNMLGSRIATLGHTHAAPMGLGLFGQPLWWGSWFMVAVWLFPLWWYWSRKRKEAKSASDADKPLLQTKVRWMASFLVTLSLLLALIFGYALPNWFLNKIAPMHDTQGIEEEAPTAIACLTAGPYPLQIEVPTELSFKFLESGDCANSETHKLLKPIGIEHERIMHVLIVKEDFSTFAHTHPEDLGPITQEMIDNSRFGVNYTFPSEGVWRIVAQVLHDNTHTITKSFNLVIGENLSPVLITKDLAVNKVFSAEDNSIYNVSIAPDGKILAGHQTTINYHFEKDGKPVTDFSPYLGAAAHFAIWSVDLGSFVHEHGVLEVSEDGTEDHHGAINIVYAHGDGNEPISDGHADEHELSTSFGPDVKLFYAFPYPGLYKIFGQFKHGEQVITTDFMVIVDPDDHGMMMDEGEDHGH